jgi:hypothetical protein
MRMTQNKREAIASRYTRREFPSTSLMESRWKCLECGGQNMLDEGYCFWCGKEAINNKNT